MKMKLKLVAGIFVVGCCLTVFPKLSFALNTLTFVSPGEITNTAGQLIPASPSTGTYLNSTFRSLNVTLSTAGYNLSGRLNVQAKALRLNMESGGVISGFGSVYCQEIGPGVTPNLILVPATYTLFPWSLAIEIHFSFKGVDHYVWSVSR